MFVLLVFLFFPNFSLIYHYDNGNDKFSDSRGSWVMASKPGLTYSQSPPLISLGRTDIANDNDASRAGLFTLPQAIDPKEMSSIANELSKFATRIVDSLDFLISEGFSIHSPNPHELTIRHPSSERLYQLISDNPWISGWNSITIANHEKIGVKPTLTPYNVPFDFINNRSGSISISELYPIYLKWHPKIDWDRNTHARFITVTVGFGKLTADASFDYSSPSPSLSSPSIEPSERDVYHYIGPIRIYLPTTLISHKNFTRITCNIPIGREKFKSHDQDIPSPVQVSFTASNNPISQVKMAKEAIATLDSQSFNHLWENASKKSTKKKKKKISPLAISTAALGHNYFGEAMNSDHDWIGGRDKKGKSLKMAVLVNSAIEQLLDEESDPLVKAVIKKDFKTILNVLNNGNYRISSDNIRKCIEISAMNDSCEILSFLIDNLKPYMEKNQELVRSVIGTVIHNNIDPRIATNLLSIYSGDDSKEWVIISILTNLNPLNIIAYSQKIGIDPQELIKKLSSNFDYRADYKKVFFGLYCYMAMSDSSVRIIDPKISIQLKENLEIIDFIIYIISEEERNPVMIAFLQDKLHRLDGLEPFPNIINLLLSANQNIGNNNNE